ncbi:MAG TPA: AAA family ATPase [Burkholderiales bacterium]|nr:AAA family ATPase [Burkholderiales bacterium]
MASIEMLVLLSGPVAVGKTTLRQALMATHQFDYVRSSGYLKQIAAQRSLKGERTGLQDLGDDLDRLTDYRWLLDEVARPGFAASPDQRRWLIDAVRKHRQVEHLRAAYGDAILHVHLHASEAVLRQRYAARDDVTPYDVAVQHDNEIASRSLVGIADLVIDMGATPVEQAAQLVAGRLKNQP